MGLIITRDRAYKAVRMCRALRRLRKFHGVGLRAI